MLGAPELDAGLQVGSDESGVKVQNHLLRKAAVRAHAWQQTQEGQKQTAGIGAKASQTIAKGSKGAESPPSTLVGCTLPTPCYPLQQPCYTSNVHHRITKVGKDL